MLLKKNIYLTITKLSARDLLLSGCQTKLSAANFDSIGYLFSKVSAYLSKYFCNQGVQIGDDSFAYSMFLSHYMLLVVKEKANWWKSFKQMLNFD